MIVTGHQVNFLPGVSVIEKVRAADAVIWMDCFQYRRHGFVNRNRLAVNDAWMTVPVDEHQTFAPIREVLIADPVYRVRQKIARRLEQGLGGTATPFVDELLAPHERLVSLNWALLEILLDRLGVRKRMRFQSFLEAGTPLPADPIVGENELALMPGRERLAAMVKEIGGTVWLSGPTGDRYLNEEPFRARGIEVRYFPKMGPNPSAITLLQQARPRRVERFAKAAA
jgi:hypothetical protein